MTERDPGLRHKIAEAVTGDRTVQRISFVTGLGSVAAGVYMPIRGIHTIEDALLWGGASTFAAGSGLVFGYKTALIEKQNKDK